MTKKNHRKKTSKKLKLNTHELLKEFHGLSEYPDLAKRAVSLAKDGFNERTILEKIRELVVILELNKPTMRGTIGDLSIFPPKGGTIPTPVVEQMSTAMRIPPATQGALMPDAHFGYSLPIGGVIELDNAISPAFVGFDIACMVQLTTFDLTFQDFDEGKTLLANALSGATAFGKGRLRENAPYHAIMDIAFWNEISILKENKDLARKQLGSSGGGNHFADIVKGTTLLTVPGFENTGDTFIGLLTHSGSRGVGHKIATHYMRLADKETSQRASKIPKGYGWFDMNSDLGKEYFTVMSLMGSYAQANHSIIHEDFATFADNIFEVSKISCKHNYVWKEERDGTTIMVHRKGATPAHDFQLGLIPGTSSTPSYVTIGLGNPLSLYSSSHGAGRNFSRRVAKELYDEKLYREDMEDKHILHRGVAPDETSQAYKDIEEVMDGQDGIILDKIAQLDPVVVIMGGEEANFDIKTI